MNEFTELFKSRLRRALIPTHSAATPLPVPTGWGLDLLWKNDGLAAGVTNGGIISGTGYAQQSVTLDDLSKNSNTINFNKGTENWSANGPAIYWALTAKGVGAGGADEIWCYGQCRDTSQNVQSIPLTANDPSPVFNIGTLSMVFGGYFSDYLVGRIHAAINSGHSEHAVLALPTDIKMHLYKNNSGLKEDAPTGEYTDVETNSEYVPKSITLDDAGWNTASVVFIEKTPTQSWGTNATYAAMVGTFAGEDHVIVYSVIKNRLGNTESLNVGLNAEPIAFYAGEVFLGI